MKSLLCPSESYRFFNFFFFTGLRVNGTFPGTSGLLKVARLMGTNFRVKRSLSLNFRNIYSDTSNVRTATFIFASIELSIGFIKFSLISESHYQCVRTSTFIAAFIELLIGFIKFSLNFESLYQSVPTPTCIYSPNSVSRQISFLDFILFPAAFTPTLRHPFFITSTPDAYQRVQIQNIGPFGTLIKFHCPVLFSSAPLHLPTMLNLPLLKKYLVTHCNLSVGSNIYTSIMCSKMHSLFWPV